MKEIAVERLVPWEPKGGRVRVVVETQLLGEKAPSLGSTGELVVSWESNRASSRQACIEARVRR